MLLRQLHAGESEESHSLGFRVDIGFKQVKCSIFILCSFNLCCQCLFLGVMAPERNQAHPSLTLWLKKRAGFLGSRVHALAPSL